MKNENQLTILYNADAQVTIDSRVRYLSHEFDEPTRRGKIVLDRSCNQIDMRAFRANPSLQSVVIPEGIETIGISAFEGCTNLRKVSLPKGLREIKQDAFAHTGLTEIQFPSTLEKIGSGAFRMVKMEKVVIPPSVREIGTNAFMGTRYLYTDLRDESVGFGKYKTDPHFGATYQNIQFEDGFLYEDPQKTHLLALKDKDMTSFTIPSAVRWIGEGLFSDCRNLREIVIPRSVEQIDGFAFSGCTNLSKVIFEDGSNLRSIEARAFAYCKSLRTINLSVGKIRSIGPGAFYGCCSLEEITFPETVYEIAAQVCATCTSLRKVTILSDEVGEIEWSAFQGCTSLQDIHLPKSVKVLRPKCFEGCHSLRSIELPPLLRHIGAMAFANCPSLSKLELPESCRYLGYHWISGDEQLTVKNPQELAEDTELHEEIWELDESEDCKSLMFDTHRGVIQCTNQEIAEDDSPELRARLRNLNKKITLCRRKHSLC